MVVRVGDSCRLHEGSGIISAGDFVGDINDGIAHRITGFSDGIACDQVGLSRRLRWQLIHVHLPMLDIS